MRYFIKRLQYFLFRWFYMLSQYVIFWVARKPCNENSAPGLVLVCGIELNDAHSIQKLMVIRDQVCSLGHEPCMLTKLSPPAKKSVSGIRYVSWEYKERARLCGIIGRLLYRKGRNDESALREVVKDARLMVDLGDYQLTSRKATGFSANMLANITFAAANGIPYIACSQSYGPFTYPRLFNPLLKRMIKSMLPSCRAIYARESWAKKALTDHMQGLAVVVKPDLLFSNQCPELGVLPKRRIVLIPDENLLCDEQDFAAYLELLQQQSLPFEILVYDTADCRLYRERYAGLRCVSSLHDDPFYSFTNLDPEAVYMTSKYHAGITLLKHGHPAVAIAGNLHMEELYNAFGIQEMALVMPRVREFTEVLAVARDMEIHKESSIRIREQLEPYRRFSKFELLSD